MLETIDLDVEESNELLFKVQVEGVEPAPAKVRLVCEAGDLAYMFNGHPMAEDGIVQFLLPALKDKLKEGVYQSRVEVLIENRYFAPVQFNINFKKAVKVVAEAVQLPQRRVAPQVKVTAAPVVVKKPTPVVEPVSQPRPIVVEKPAVATQQQQRVAPPPAKVAAATTLKERYASKAEKKVELVDEIDSNSEELLRELARGFVRRR